jgi:hypothetical protein
VEYQERVKFTSHLFLLSRIESRARLRIFEGKRSHTQVEEAENAYSFQNSTNLRLDVETVVSSSKLTVCPSPMVDWDTCPKRDGVVFTSRSDGVLRGEGEVAYYYFILQMKRRASLSW